MEAISVALWNDSPFCGQFSVFEVLTTANKLFTMVLMRKALYFLCAVLVLVILAEGGYYFLLSSQRSKLISNRAPEHIGSSDLGPPAAVYEENKEPWIVSSVRATQDEQYGEVFVATQPLLPDRQIRQSGPFRSTGVCLREARNRVSYRSWPGFGNSGRAA